METFPAGREAVVIYGSICSGIEGASAAWHPLGWTCSFVSEIDRVCNKVLAHRWPGVPNVGDFTRVRAGDVRPIDLLVGGTPCQSFSVAGLRAGVGDPRGVLAFEFLRLAGRLRPRWVVFENVPGLLSSNRGRDFGGFLGSLGECGYGFAYRVLDARFFGVPQRRRRVFVVGYLGDWRPAAAVLLESGGLLGNSPAGLAEGSDLAPAVAGCLNSGGQRGGFRTEPGEHLTVWDRQEVTHTLRAEGFDASEDGTGRGTPIIPIDMRQASRGATMTNNRREGSSGGAPGTGIGSAGDPSPSLSLSHVPAIAFQCHGTNVGEMGTLRKGNGNTAGGVPFVATFDERNVTSPQDRAIVGPNRPCRTLHREPPRLISGGVRRLTPTECERLQGFPDGYTRVPVRCQVKAKSGRLRKLREEDRLEEIGGVPWEMLADGPRYRMLGNSFAVPVVRWIGRRVDAVEAFLGSIKASG